MRRATEIEETKYRDYRVYMNLLGQALSFEAWRLDRRRSTGEIQYGILTAADKLTFLMRFIFPVILAQEAGEVFDPNTLNDDFQGNEAVMFDAMVYKGKTWEFKEKLKDHIKHKFNEQIRVAIEEIKASKACYLNNTLGPTTQDSRDVFVTLTNNLIALLEGMEFDTVTAEDRSAYIETKQFYTQMIQLPTMVPAGARSVKRIETTSARRAPTDLFSAKRLKTGDTAADTSIPDPST